MEQYQDDHDFCIWQGRCSMIFALFRHFCWFKGRFCHHSLINFAEFICHKENFCNFALGEHSEINLYGCFWYYKYTNYFAILQIFKQLYFRRTHVRIGVHGARKVVLESTAHGIIIGDCDTLQQGAVSKNTVADRTQGTRQTNVLQGVTPSEHIGSNNIGIRVIIKK